MSIAAPLIADPRNQLLGTLPFSSASGRDQCQAVVRRAFDATDDKHQRNVYVMLHLKTKNGPTLLEMIANVVQIDSDSVVILTGREVDSSLTGLLHHEGSVAPSEPESITDSIISSVTMPSMLAEPNVTVATRSSDSRHPLTTPLASNGARNSIVEDEEEHAWLVGETKGTAMKQHTSNGDAEAFVVRAV